jgi:hypothetical protein
MAKIGDVVGSGRECCGSFRGFGRSAQLRDTVAQLVMSRLAQLGDIVAQLVVCRQA